MFTPLHIGCLFTSDVQATRAQENRALATARSKVLHRAHASGSVDAMSLNPFHAKEIDEAAQRPASEVFSSSAKALESGISSRFASSGKFTTEQLEDGADLAVLEKGGLQVPKKAHSEEEFDPDDKRSLYERLKAQKDAKQEEFEHNAAFKNQMDHWRMDEDEAAFEDERLLKLRQQEMEKQRLQEEASNFYKLALAAQERPIQPAPSLASASLNAAVLKRKAPAAKSAIKPNFKVLKVVPKGEAESSTSSAGAASTTAYCAVAESAVSTSTSATSTAAQKPASSAAPSNSGGLPGMGAYDDSDDDDDDNDE